MKPTEEGLVTGDEGPTSIPYGSPFSELYDLFHAEKRYEEEAAFVHALITEWLPDGARESIVDLACGTGRHALAFAKLGHRVLGIDRSPGMIAIARDTAASVGSSVDFLCSDIAELPPTLGTFDVATCLFDSIGYLETNQRITQAFREIERHLPPGGLFVLEFWHAAAMLRNFEAVRVKRWELPDESVVRVSETRISVEDQVAEVHYSVTRLKEDGHWESFRETHRNRFFLVQEMNALLSTCGLLPVKAFAGYTAHGAVDEDCWHIVLLARRQ